MRLTKVAVVLLLSAATALCANTPDVETIVQKSVQANKRDFEAAPEFSHKERDKTASGSKTYQVLMIDGSPYQRLIEVNGEPISKADAEAEAQKEQQERNRRAHETAQQRQARIAKYQKGRNRDNAMMSQLTKAFTFTYIGQKKVDGFDVIALKATPKPGYQPANMQTQVLPGMEGELWIDSKTFQWVRVMAHVIHPVSIDGFLAQVEPGTQFELEKKPVSEDIWLPSYFCMKANAKVFYLFNHNSSEEDHFWDYQPLAKR